MRSGHHPLAFLRAAFLCALFAFVLGPQTADAHVDDLVVSIESEVHSVEDHRETHSLIEDALGHCHPGLDCAVTAIAVEPTQAPHGTGFGGERFRPGHIQLNGLGLADEPPPPRDFV